MYRIHFKFRNSRHAPNHAEQIVLFFMEGSMFLKVRVDPVQDLMWAFPNCTWAYYKPNARTCSRCTAEICKSRERKRADPGKWWVVKGDHYNGVSEKCCVICDFKYMYTPGGTQDTCSIIQELGYPFFLCHYFWCFSPQTSFAGEKGRKTTGKEREEIKLI